MGDVRLAAIVSYVVEIGDPRSRVATKSCACSSMVGSPALISLQHVTRSA